MLNILVLLAGKGQRFVDAGYIVPKPFIEWKGQQLLSHVIGNVTPIEPHRWIFVARKEHEEYMKEYQEGLPSAQVVYIKEVTDGAARSALFASSLIDNDDELLIVNSDQKAIFREQNSIQPMLNYFKEFDGGIATFKSSETKWSYARTVADRVTEVKEKEVISSNATVGIYYYKKGRDFVRAATNMIKNNDTFCLEFYVAPVFNWAIKDGKKITFCEIEEMISLGTPEDLERAQCI